MYKHIISAIILLSVAICASAQTDVRFGNEASDTTRIDEMLIKGAARQFATPNDRVAFFGKLLVDTPYGAGTLEGEPEVLTVRIDSVDCTTFVETAMALAMTNMERRSSWRDFVFNLRRIRYRNGEVDGYPSRLHYICDWAVDNIHRGNFRDATTAFPKATYAMKSIDFMTNNRDKYPALADSANFARMRMIENGYRRHRYPFIKSNDLNLKGVKADLKNGDVVALVTNIKNLDVTHMGIILKDSPTAEPYLLHASSSDGKVEISKYPLGEFMRRNRQWAGVRLFRLAE